MGGTLRRRVLALAAALLIIASATALALARPWDRAPVREGAAATAIPSELAAGTSIAVPATAGDVPSKAETAPVSPVASLRPGAQVVLTDSVVAALRAPVEGELEATVETIDDRAQKVSLRVVSFSATYVVSATQPPVRLVLPNGSLVRASLPPTGEAALALRPKARVRLKVRIGEAAGRTEIEILSESKGASGQ